MIPVLTPSEMAAVDAASPVPFEQLVERAGFAVARAALRLLGGSYGRRVAVVCGPGNNGNDGRVAARILRSRGVVVTVIDALDPRAVPPCDLVIDAAFGTGFRGTYESPVPHGMPVLAVDIPSGVDGLTGESRGRPAPALATVTFAALKPGLLLDAGAALSGRIEVADIGLDPWPRHTGLVTDDDVRSWITLRPRTAHKWGAAVWVIGGSPGMAGAPMLAALGASAAGAGYVRVSTPGCEAPPSLPPECVGHPLPSEAWAPEVAADRRVAAIVVGPGLGRSPASVASVRDLVCARSTGVPIVVDGDGLWALSPASGFGDLPLRRTAHSPLVVTPHDGEFAALTGAAPGADRIDAVRSLASALSAIVLLKGPTTVIAEPGGGVRLVTSGDQRLATAGSGDVLSGVIGARLAAGDDPFDAVSSAAQVHGSAGRMGPLIGTTASDLPDAISAVLSGLVR